MPRAKYVIIFTIHLKCPTVDAWELIIRYCVNCKQNMFEGCPEIAYNFTIHISSPEWNKKYLPSTFCVQFETSVFHKICQITSFCFLLGPAHFLWERKNANCDNNTILKLDSTMSRLSTLAIVLSWFTIVLTTSPSHCYA